MRYEEAASVCVKDIDFQNRRISILNPKGGNQQIRQIQVSTYLIGRIQNYIQVKKLNINSTFSFPTNADLNYNIKKYSKLIGINDYQDLSCHNLRKTLIMWGCALNVNSSVLAHFMGHKVSTEEAFYTSSMLFNAQEKSLIRSILDDLFI
jgi:integrase